MATRLTLIRGDDYNEIDGRAIMWSDDSNSGLDLTGATVTLSINDYATGDVIMEKDGTVVSATAATKVVQVELDSTETLSFDEGKYPYEVKCALASGRIITLAEGECIFL